MATMTLHDVMKLEGRGLDLATAVWIGWTRDDYFTWHSPRIRGVQSHGGLQIIPNYSTDWNAAMQIREWARETQSRRRPFVHYVLECLYARTTHGDIFMDSEPIDYARAALLVSRD